MKLIPNFIVFEGGDGSGTSTQLSLLSERLKNFKKPSFFPTFEPTAAPIGRLIRGSLKKEPLLAPQSLCYLFAADRHEHLYGAGGIIERAGKGELVVSDRYTLSSLVYQGIECGDELPKMLNSAFPVPEITLFFDIKPEIALERVKNRAKNPGGDKPLEIYEYLDFQRKVYGKYLSVVENYKKEGARLEIIDASKTASEVADTVWSILSQMPIMNQGENSF